MIIKKTKKPGFNNKALFLGLTLFTASVESRVETNLLADSDKDGIVNALDNCIQVANPQQVDSDQDGIGNRCDPDINNDNTVDHRDIELIKSAQTKKAINAPEDLNTDGRINEEDIEWLMPFYEKKQPPGPTAFNFESRFINNPPRVESIAFFQVQDSNNSTLKSRSFLSELSASTSKNQPDEKQNNAAVMIRFGKEVALGKTITIAPDDKVLALNDLGLEADVRAGDGIFSGFVDVDFEQRDKLAEQYLSRLKISGNQTVFKFAGRSVVDQTEFQRDQRKLMSFKRPIKLSDGKVLIPVKAQLETTALAASTAPEKTSGINHLSVTQDSSRTYNPCLDGNFSANSATDGNVNGAWSFKTLMSNMANTGLTGISAQAFIHQWLTQWMSDQTVNGFTIPARTNIQNFFPGWDQVNASSLDIDHLPFRLLAIMNRIDLANSSLYGATNAPGETRFVFGLVDPVSCSARPMTVILEYQDTTPHCSAIKSRANSWVALDGLTLPSAAFNNQLQAITDTVTLADAAPSRPNGSAIGQIRTNDFAFSTPWQLREFRIKTGSPQLQPDTIKQTPHEPQYNAPGPDDVLLAEFLHNNANDVLCDAHSINELQTFTPGTQTFLTGHVDYSLGDFWDAPINPASLPTSFPSCYQSSTTLPPVASDIPSEVIHKLSINTCDDCHSGETLTNFVHVNWSSNTAFTIPASFSNFVTGASGAGHFVSDPRGSGLTREFNEFARRGQRLDDLATQSCGLAFDSLSVHTAGFKFIH